MSSIAEETVPPAWGHKPFWAAIFASIVIHFSFFELFSVPPLDQSERLAQPGRVVEIDPKIDIEAKRLVDSLLAKRPFLPSFDSWKTPLRVDLSNLNMASKILQREDTYEAKLLPAPDLELSIPLPSVVGAGVVRLPDVVVESAGDSGIDFSAAKAFAKCSTDEGPIEPEWPGTGDRSWIGQIWVAHLGIDANGEIDELVWIDAPPREADFVEFESWIRSRDFGVSDQKCWKILRVEWEVAND